MIKADREYINQVLSEMVQTDSRNPSMTLDGPGEEEIGTRVAGWLDELGLQVSIQHLSPGRVNVIGTLPGSGAGRSLILNGHLDTVGVEEMTDPFSARMENGRLFGRGSHDMKGSLAAMLGAIKALRDSGNHPDGDLIFTAVADEENQSLGTMELVKSLQADGVIVTEPTDLKVISSHRGFLWLEVEVFGKAVHGSNYLEGKDAILQMGRVLVELERLGEDLIKRTVPEGSVPPSLHTSLINGGSDMCTYPGRCVVSVERRTVEGESDDQVVEEIQGILDRLKETDNEFEAQIRLIASRSLLARKENSDLLKSLQKAYQKQQGVAPEVAGAAYWTDAALFAEMGMDAIVIGPKGAGLHSPEEWVELSSLYDLAEILAETALSYCV